MFIYFSSLLVDFREGGATPFGALKSSLSDFIGVSVLSDLKNLRVDTVEPPR